MFDEAPAKQSVPPRTNRERFEDRIHPIPLTGCWIFDSGTAKRPMFPMRMPAGDMGHRLGYRGFTAARAAWMIYRGEIPAGKMICHKCDVPSCVNPDHLYPGTAQDNMDDRMGGNRYGFYRPEAA